MSNLSISNQYSIYSNLISQTYQVNQTPNTMANSLMGMYSFIYGTNDSNVSEKTSSYLVELKESANTAISTIDDIKNSKNDDKIYANSDNSSVSASYTGKEKRDDIEINISQIATSQKNEGASLKNNSSSIYYSNSRNISISTNDGKKLSLNYSAATSESNEDALSKISAKINKANIGVTATVETDEKTKSSKLVLSSNKTGVGNEFSVSGDLAKTLGIDKVSQEATNAIYSINGEEKVSSSNKVQVDSELTLSLKKETDKTANISFGEDKLETINSARALVNAFNGIAHTAYSSDDDGANRLGEKLQATAKTYAPSLSKIGISLNQKGYLEIDEDKMAKASESGKLDEFFNSNGKTGLSYGFVNRLENIAKKANDDPTQFLSSEGRLEVSSSSSYYNINKATSYNYINAYYKYSNVALLFNAMV